MPGPAVDLNRLLAGFPLSGRTSRLASRSLDQRKMEPRRCPTNPPTVGTKKPASRGQSRRASTISHPANVSYLIRYSHAARHLSSEGAGRNSPVSETGSHAAGEGALSPANGRADGMPNSRPMPAVGGGVSELRVKTQDGAYRAFYYTASQRGILVFHALVKKTRQTPPLEIELARKRLKEILDA